MKDTHSNFYSSNGKRRVLLVEDELINQEILKNILQEDYDVVTADTGGEALDILRAQHDTISIMLLDLNLPDMHGSQVLKEVKSDPKYAAIPVIVMTAEEEAEVECLNLGAIDFIPKPYPRQKVILARINRTIELSEDRDILRWTERDHLTGLYNKEFFYHYAFQFDMFHKEIPTDAIVLDINHFHMINDRYGKAYGDMILKRIAKQALLFFDNSYGIVCRSDADTFLIYCLHRDDYTEMHEAISTALNKDENHEYRIRLRMGVYSDTDKSLDVERRFDRAKMAADTVRGSFTNVIGFYDDSMHESEILAEQLIEDFTTAVREKQFVVYYQPKYDVTHNEPVLSSAEALVRWIHPTLGFINPGVFIPLFENNGLVQDLDHFVWAQAAAQIRDWKERLGTTVPVSVNVSRVDLYDPDMIEKLERMVEDNHLDRSELILEITESAYTDDSKQIVAKVEQLRKLGYKIEMDDFGTGYSSLCMLSDLPIDALKLDIHFIRSAFRNRKDTRLLEEMIRLAASFNVPTIAEGVETAEQVFTLKAMGCDIIQGYYFSPPVPADRFEAFITGETAPEGFTVEKAKKTRRDRFTYKALHDPLTGLYNYSAFEILFHDSDWDHIAVALAVVRDFDKIKRENGKDYADRIICRIADALHSNFRSADHICRLSEDEFAVIITRVTSADKEVVLSRFGPVIKTLSKEEDGLCPVSLDLGIALSDPDQPERDVFQDADTALNRLKESGSTGYAIFE